MALASSYDRPRMCRFTPEMESGRSPSVNKNRRCAPVYWLDDRSAPLVVGRVVPSQFPVARFAVIVRRLPDMPLSPSRALYARGRRYILESVKTSHQDAVRGCSVNLRNIMLRAAS